jgi:hypothetical protein
LQLRFVLQAIAGLGFDGRRAARAASSRDVARGCEQFFFAGRARERDRAQNAAAGSGNLLIGGAGDALLELAARLPAKDQVRVRIDKAGRDAAALASMTHCVGRDFGSSSA